MYCRHFFSKFRQAYSKLLWKYSFLYSLSSGHFCYFIYPIFKFLAYFTAVCLNVLFSKLVYLISSGNRFYLFYRFWSFSLQMLSKLSQLSLKDNCKSLLNSFKCNDTQLLQISFRVAVCLLFGLIILKYNGRITGMSSALKYLRGFY